MVWGAFCSDGTLVLGFPSTRMNSEEYQNVLNNNLLPFISRYSNISYTFQQDNASIHISRSTKTWFSENNVTVLDWPACSPDLNPMENLWSILVREVYKENKQYDSIKELRVAIQTSWSLIKSETLRNLVSSMPNRIFQCINKNGAVTNY